MAVKVLIERWVRSGHEPMVWEMLRDLRGQALRCRGYLYGETWRSITNPRVFVVLSVWASREHWESWAQDPFRLKVDERINRMLTKPSSIKLFEELTGPPEPSQGQRRGGGRVR
ncbi:MAG: antibiotic biosynthesis monooxygenase family protein [Dehalococcoidia bacterium]